MHHIVVHTEQAKSSSQNGWQLVLLGLISPLLVLLGVWWTNKCHATRQQKDFLRDADDTKEQRSHDLKRERYLEFVDTLHTASAFIGRLPRLSFKDLLEHEPVVKLRQATAKLELTASLKAVKAANAVADEIDCLVLIIAAARIEADETGRELDSLAKLIGQDEETQKRLYIEMEKESFAGPPAGAKWNHLRFLDQRLGDRLVKYAKEEHGKKVKREELLNGARLEAHEAIKLIYEKTADLLGVFRADLGETPDVAFFKDVFAQSLEKSMAAGKTYAEARKAFLERPVRNFVDNTASSDSE